MSYKINGNRETRTSVHDDGLRMFDSEYEYGIIRLARTLMILDKQWHVMGPLVDMIASVHMASMVVLRKNFRAILKRE